MDSGHALYDLTPILRVALMGIALAAGPLAWVWLRNREAGGTGRLHALTLLTLFLTFDLVLPQMYFHDESSDPLLLVALEVLPAWFAHRHGSRCST